MYPKIFKLLFHTCKVYFRLCFFLGIGSKQILPSRLGPKPFFSGRVCGRFYLSSLTISFENTSTRECVFSGVPSAPEKRVERRDRKGGNGRPILHHQGHLAHPHRAQGNRVGAWPSAGGQSCRGGGRPCCQGGQSGAERLCIDKARLQAEWHTQSLKSNLVPRPQILGQFGPPKKRVNFDIYKMTWMGLLCIDSVNLTHLVFQNKFSFVVL